MFHAIESDRSFPDSFQPVFRCLGEPGRKNAMALIVHSPQGLTAADIRRGLLSPMDKPNISASTVANYLMDLEDSGLVMGIRDGNKKSGGHYVATEFGLETFRGVIELGRDLVMLKVNAEIDRLLARFSSPVLDRVIKLAQDRISKTR